MDVRQIFSRGLCEISLNSGVKVVFMLVRSLSSSQDATPMGEMLWIMVASTWLNSSSYLDNWWHVVTLIRTDIDISVPIHPILVIKV